MCSKVQSLNQVHLNNAKHAPIIIVMVDLGCEFINILASVIKMSAKYYINNK